MKGIGEEIYALVDGRINFLKIQSIDARNGINPSYYASNSHCGKWLRDSDSFDSIDELIDNLKSVVVR